MYLIKILVFQVIQLLVRSAPEQPVSKINNDGPESEKINMALEKELIDTVIEYYNRIDKNDLLPIDDSMPNYMCGQLIKHIHIQYLENNLLIILKQMFNHYLIQLENLNLYNIIKLFESEYVETICTHIPRCLDFIYICTPRFTTFNKILSLHSELCVLRKTFLLEIPVDIPCDMTNTSSNLKNDITSLSRPFSGNKAIPINTEYHTAKDDGSFVKKIFEIVNKIDKTIMISVGDWTDKLILLDYYDSNNLEVFPKQEESSLFTYDINDKTIRELNQMLKSIICYRSQKFLKEDNGNNAITIFEENYENHKILVSLLKELLRNVLHGFKYHFKMGVSDGAKNDAENKYKSKSINYDTMRSILKIDMLQEVCQQIPIILYYLASNKIIDESSFSLYYTMCSDWIYFLTLRCECGINEHEEILYDLQCVKKSVEEKLLLNHYMVFRTTENNDFIFKNGMPEIQDMKLIIQSIYNQLNRFYKDRSIFLWPTFNWLIGIHIFTESFPSDSMNEIKQQIVRLGNEGIVLLEIYNQLLPWNLNIKSIFGFHKLTERYIFDNIFQYVWRQAKIIKYYFEHFDVKYDNYEVFERLKKSTLLYRSGLEKINDGKFTVPCGIKFIIDAIENIGKETVNNISIALDHSSNREKNWIFEEISVHNKSDLLAHLNKIFLLNCYNALEYINTYILILNKLNVKSKNIDTINYQKICENQDLGNVFVVSQGQTRKYSESHDEDDASQEKLKQLRTI